ncbi:MAG TPA: UTP--glucose-1-phosphate uridylyltransferase [Thermoleophilaceae bacterium]|nr:UTP--glucose-1-phosphate uridylyltransferase [Thermoleophilaceae bacterium]
MALERSVEKMEAEGVHEAAIAAFTHAYEALAGGETGILPEADIEPVSDLPRADELPEGDPGDLAKAVVIKLNGGLGTSMGMTKAKSLVEVKDGLTFLDLIAHQATTAGVPLLLMNSFRTRDESLAVLERYPDLQGDLPLDFVQNKEPKLEAESLDPVEWDADPEMEWCPPGHGDIYPALVASGLLEQLLERGYETAFVSNADNLGAVLDPRILSWFRAEEIPFLMEVSRRGENDRKGGHVARRLADGQLVLRESAQTADEDEDAFQDINRHRFFNTNSLWIDLRALAAKLDAEGGALPLPLIVNRKTVDPGDPGSPEVIQLETAMGAAIGVFDGAQAIEVGRRRFAPVKTTNDLLVLRSDCYEVTDDWRVVLAGGRDAQPGVDLDSDHYKLLADFEARFPEGPPSLVGAERLVVRGDVTFGAGVVVTGVVEVDGPAEIPDGARLP